MPVDAEISNKITRQVIEETDGGLNLIRCQNAEKRLAGDEDIHTFRPVRTKIVSRTPKYTTKK